MRVEYAGAIYHLMSRGDRREDIFLDDVDRQDFLKTLAEACQKTGFQVHAYCLMRHHFHLVIETPKANLVAGMAWLLSAYTIGLNHRHKLFGHVFAGRYKALVVDGSGGGYLRTVSDYVDSPQERSWQAGCGRADEKRNDLAAQMDRWASGAGDIKKRQREAASMDASQRETPLKWARAAMND
jgi:REP element-mobilizing transposase RayT